MCGRILCRKRGPINIGGSVVSGIDTKQRQHLMNVVSGWLDKRWYNIDVWWEIYNGNWGDERIPWPLSVLWEANEAKNPVFVHEPCVHSSVCLHWIGHSHHGHVNILVSAETESVRSRITFQPDQVLSAASNLQPSWRCDLHSQNFSRWQYLNICEEYFPYPIRHLNTKERQHLMNVVFGQDGLTNTDTTLMFEERSTKVINIFLFTYFYFKYLWLTYQRKSLKGVSIGEGWTYHHLLKAYVIHICSSIAQCHQKGKFLI
jgi:hypothetical protein